MATDAQKPHLAGPSSTTLTSAAGSGQPGAQEAASASVSSSPFPRMMFPFSARVGSAPKVSLEPRFWFSLFIRFLTWPKL